MQRMLHRITGLDGKMEVHPNRIVFSPENKTIFIKSISSIELQDQALLFYYDGNMHEFAFDASKNSIAEKAKETIEGMISRSDYSAKAENYSELAETGGIPKSIKIYTYSAIALLLLVATAVIVGILWGMGKGGDAVVPERDEIYELNSNAIVCAKVEIVKYLLSPSSADFPYTGGRDYAITYAELPDELNNDTMMIVTSGAYTIAYLENNEVLVKGYVDSDNVFGASIRTEWAVGMKFDDIWDSYDVNYLQLGDEVYILS